MRGALRDRLGTLATRAKLQRLALRNRTTILVFHRVDGRHPGNPLACAPELFEQYCKLLHDHFDPIGLDELLDRLARGRPIGNAVVVTFDDGYLDNHTTAAPILERWKIPATFFVTGNFIGSGHQAWWDIEQGVRSEWMDWDQVADLSQRGFLIGAHTMNHVDLGQVVGEKARREIQQSRESIEDHIGQRTSLFSYPFGRRKEFTESNRALVEELGFSCCLSAFGGSVRPNSNPFALPRLPVSTWYQTPGQLALELLRNR